MDINGLSISIIPKQFTSMFQSLEQYQEQEMRIYYAIHTFSILL